VNEYGAVPLEPPKWQQMMDEGATYEEIQREFTIDTLAEFWQIENEALGLSSSDPADLRQMFELMVDGAVEEVVAAMMPREAT
jgi:hypothetical protein